MEIFSKAWKKPRNNLTKKRIKHMFLYIFEKNIFLLNHNDLGCVGRELH